MQKIYESFLVVLAMVNTCCVAECKTGYKSHKNHPKIALFQFPSKEVLKNKWLKSISQKNWTFSSSHKVCAKHFHENDLITKSTNIFKNFLNKLIFLQMFMRISLTAAAFHHFLI